MNERIVPEWLKACTSAGLCPSCNQQTQLCLQRYWCELVLKLSLQMWFFPPFKGFFFSSRPIAPLSFGLDGLLGPPLNTQAALSTVLTGHCGGLLQRPQKTQCSVPRAPCCLPPCVLPFIDRLTNCGTGWQVVPGAAALVLQRCGSHSVFVALVIWFHLRLPALINFLRLLGGLGTLGPGDFISHPIEPSVKLLSNQLNGSLYCNLKTQGTVLCPLCPSNLVSLVHILLLNVHYPRWWCSASHRFAVGNTSEKWFLREALLQGHQATHVRPTLYVDRLTWETYCFSCFMKHVH